MQTYLQTLQMNAQQSDRGTRLGVAERRAHPRIPVDIPAAIDCRGTVRPVRIKDISQGGMMLEGAFGLFDGDRVTIRTLRGREFAGRIAWALGSHCGVKFDMLLYAMDPILKPSAKGGERSRR